MVTFRELKAQYKNKDGKTFSNALPIHFVPALPDRKASGGNIYPFNHSACL